MNTISIDVSEKTSKTEVENIIKKNKVKEGDTIKIYKGDLDLESLILLGFFMVLAGVLIDYSLKKKNTKSFEKILSDNKSVKDIEKYIEEQAGVKIDIEEKPNASSDPIEDVFGIWKNRKNFNKEKFRDDAWRKIS